MFNRRYFLSLLIVLSLMLTAAGYAFAAGFTDTRGHWAEGQINKWAEKGLAGGYSDGTFKPNNQVTRAEFVALVNRAFGIETKGFAANFSDVNSSQWYYNDIAAASAAGYTGGYPDGTFKPQQSISRQEAASILVRLLKLEPTTQGLEGFKDAGQIPQWSRSSIGAIAKAGLMAGYPDGTFQPGKSITRAEAVVALDRAREFAPVTPPVIEEATLQGTVTLDGKAVSGATVRVFKAGGYEDIKETETDSKGYFEFALAAGDYDLTAVTDNKVAYQSDITVVKDEKATAKLELVPAAVVSGTLYDENRTKVQNAKMLFTTNPTFVIYTGNDGKFKGAVLPDSTYTVQVYKPGKEDEDPLLLAEDVAVGAAGTRSLGIFKAPFSLSAPGGGGGIGGGGGTVTPAEPVVLTEIGTGTYDNPNGYIINSFGTFGPSSGTATFTTKLTIDPGDSGALKLRNITAANIEILSGGKNSVHTENLIAGNVTVKATNGVKVQAGAGTVITTTEVEGETHLEVADGVNLGEIKIKPVTGGKTIEFSGNLTNSNISVETGNVTLQANSGVKMGQVVINAPGTINLAGEGSFGDIEVSAEAGKSGTPVININPGTTVNKLVLSTNVKLEGDVAGVPLEVTDPDVEIIIEDENLKNELLARAKGYARDAIAGIKDTITLDDEADIISVRNKVNAVKVLNNGTIPGDLVIDRLVDAEAVIVALKGVNIQYAVGDSAESVTNDLNLPDTSGNLAVTWVSNNSSVVDVNGKVTRQENDVTVILTATVKKGDITGKKTFTVTVKGVVVLPKINSFAGKAPDANNTIVVPLSNIKTDTAINVSRDSKLALNVEGLGIVKQLSLKANIDNNIYNILIPDFEYIDVSELDLEKLYQATSKCPPATKEQIIKAVNFTGLFEVIKGSKPGIKDSIINDSNLRELLEIVSADENINKGDILEAVDLEDMVEALRGVITKDDLSAVLDPQDFATIITFGDDDEDLKRDIAGATDKLRDATTNDEIADAAKELFTLIKQTKETTQDAIARAMNFTALFELVNKVKGTTAKAVFDAINFTALFDAMNGASDATISELIKVTMQVIEIMQDHGITRNDILNNIKFDELDKESIFDWLCGIDGDRDVLTIQAILTDDINPESTNTYTINIHK